jgi:hypothetical protein
MGQLESLKELDIAQSTRVKKKKKNLPLLLSMPWLVHLIGIPMNSRVLNHLYWNYFETP